MSQAAAPAQHQPKAPRRGALGSLLLCAVALLAIVAVRVRLVRQFDSATVKSDVLALPPPQQTVVASLGYRSALADLIFSHVLVSYGMHFQEKRQFEFVGNYLDIVNALDPKFRDPYRFADTLLTLQPKRVPFANYRKAREVLERGLTELPYDTELWSSTGQFLAYVAAPQLPDPNERAAWKLDGARKLVRACELISNNENVPYHCITAARLLDDAGEHAAMAKFLERVLLVNDDPEIAAMARHYSREAADSESERRRARVQKLWGRDLPFVSRSALYVLGPRADLPRCAGLMDSESPECASSWAVWAERFSRTDANAEP